MSESRNKSRHQSLFDYLTILQKEYVQIELRKRIYTRDKDKEFFTRVLKHKGDKIKDISSRNNLYSIFDIDGHVKNQLRKDLVPEYGIPNFLYTDEEQRREFEEKDFKHYFSETSEVKILIGMSEYSVGRITKTPKLGDKTVLIKLRHDSEPKKVLIEHISRIL